MAENTGKPSLPTSIVAIGVGNRMRTYMHYVERHPEMGRLVAVVEPDDVRRKAMADHFGLPKENRFCSLDDFLRSGIKADVAFICTPEGLHYEPCMAALKAGMHVLLEKPVAQTYRQCHDICEESIRRNKTVWVCHVLRFHPVFIKIKELVASGRYGKIITVNHTENVGLDRATHSYVRGTMNTEAGNNPMLLAKCCHDIDFILWLLESQKGKVSSFGSRVWFRAENAPEGSSKRCFDCRVEKGCPYSAVDLYKRRKEWISNFDVPDGETIDGVIDHELSEGDFGRCVFHCNNDVVDNQVVTLQMDNGTLVTLCMDVFTLNDGRITDIKLTGGEIVSDGKKITVTDFADRSVKTFDYTEECNKPFHGGADLKLVEDFLIAVRGGGRSFSATSIVDSLISHQVCFKAEQSRRSGDTVPF